MSQAAADYRHALAELGVHLPLMPSGTDLGVVVDANGRDLLVVDVNCERTDRQIKELAAWIALAVNTSAGLEAEGGAHG